MKNLILILAFFFLIAATPTRVRKADQAEWLKYSAFCRTMVPDTIVQYGVKRFTRQLIAHKDFSYLPCDSCPSIIIREGQPYYEWKRPVDTVWFNVDCRDYQQNSLKKPIARTYYAEINQVFIKRLHICHVRQRRATVKDFYEKWMTKDLSYPVKTGAVTFVNKLRIVE
jgi:hypothetical protein